MADGACHWLALMLPAGAMVERVADQRGGVWRLASATEAELGGRDSLRRTRKSGQADETVKKTRRGFGCDPHADARISVGERGERRCSPIHGKSAMKRGRRLAYSVGYLWTTESRLCAQWSDQGRATLARHRGEYSWKRRCPAAAAARARDRGRTSGSRRLESDPPRLGSPSLSKRGPCHGRL